MEHHLKNSVICPSISWSQVKYIIYLHDIVHLLCYQTEAHHKANAEGAYSKVGIYLCSPTH